MRRVIFFVLFLFSPNEQRAGGGGGERCQTFFFFFFPCSADHERDWPPCKVVFSGLATNALKMRNSNNNNKKGLRLHSVCNSILLLLCLMMYCNILSSLFFWCPCMVINVSVQYNGGLLTDIILLTQCYHHKQYFGKIKNDYFLKNELFFKDPEGVNSRSARPSANCTYWLYSKACK